MTEWKDVVGYEGLYLVSDDGNILGIKRNKTLRLNMSKGCLTVGLSKSGVVKTHSVHGIVAKAFLGPRPEGLDVCHNNGDYTDNTVSNLRHDTKSGNMKDKILHGTNHEANKTHCKRGHEFDSKNTYVDKENKRKCRACRKYRRKENH